MPYVPRPATTAQCAHCGANFEKKHASRRYCSNSCNVQASYARTGYRTEGRLTRADLEQALAKMMAMMNVTPELATATPPTAAKAQAKKPAAKAAVKPARENGKFVKSATKPAAPAAKAAATKPKKKISAPAPPKPAAKAAAKPVKKTAPAAKLKLTPAEVAAIRREVIELDASAGSMNIPDEVARLVKLEVARRRSAASLTKI